MSTVKLNRFRVQRVSGRVLRELDMIPGENCQVAEYYPDIYAVLCVSKPRPDQDPISAFIPISNIDYMEIDDTEAAEKKGKSK